MIIYTFDLLGTLFFAISGAFRAVKYEYDVLGVLVMAIAVGVGGGIIRDAMLGVHPPAAMAGDVYMGICILGGLAVFFFAPKIAVRWNLVMLADAIGLGVFAAIGSSKAVTIGHTGVIGTILCGTISAVGGGVIRDVLSGEVPAILIVSDFYASTAILGSLAFWILHRCGAPYGWTFLSAAILTTVFRLFAMHYHLQLPRVRRLPQSPSHMAQQRGKS
jgi:uncharacterized membrane protein YeiH